MEGAMRHLAAGLRRGPEVRFEEVCRPGGSRRLKFCGVPLDHDRDAGASMTCRHKNVILIVTNGSKSLLKGDEEGASS